MQTISIWLKEYCPFQEFSSKKWLCIVGLGLLAGISEEDESLEAGIAIEIAEENTSVLDELFQDASIMEVSS